MAAISIPNVGEHNYRGSEPNAMVPQWYNCLVGSAATNDVVLSTQTTYALFNVPANFMVIDVLFLITTAFTASVTLTIGDGDDADGYLTSAHIAPQTALTTGAMESANENDGGYNAGKLYSAADTIDIVVGGADVAAGLMRVLVVGIQL